MRKKNIKHTRPKTEIQSVQNKQVLNSERAIIKIVNPFEIPLHFRDWPNIVHNFLNPCTNNQNSLASKCSIVNISVTELTHKQKPNFLAMSLKPAESTTTWEEWVATQAELALTSSMANLRETFVLNPKNEKKREESIYIQCWCGRLWLCGSFFS